MIFIGLSSCFMYEDPERIVFGPKNLAYAEWDMLDYLCGDSVMPILIPKVEGARLRMYLDKMDCFVLQGGADLAPESYGEEAILGERWPGDRQRDLYELELVDYAFKLRKPVLGICRGMQLMNVYFGGSLYQDLEAQKAVGFPHRDAQLYDRVHHQALIEPDSLLYRAYGKKTIEVNSVHHQGVKTLGKGLVVEARSPDGLVEAVRHESAPFWGVQWHPEFNHTLNGVVEQAAPILDTFLDIVKNNT